jgi:hypothetical protein
VEPIIKYTEIVRCEDLSLLGYGSLLIHKVTNIFKDSWNRKLSISCHVHGRVQKFLA